MNPIALIKLFKPYKLSFATVKEFFDECKGDEDLFFEILIDVECPKSKNRICANTECPYNMVKHHNDELYLEFATGGV